MYNDIQKKLVTEEQLKARVVELGKKITEDYNGEEVIVIGVLKGCTVFMADLIRQIDLPLQIDFMVASSYGDDTKTSGNVKNYIPRLVLFNTILSFYRHFQPEDVQNLLL